MRQRFADCLLGGDKNKCPTCGQYFKSTAAFSKHRTGAYGSSVTELIKGRLVTRLIPSSRRCMTMSEMRAVGMAENANGYWCSALLSEAQMVENRERWARLKAKEAT